MINNLSILFSLLVVAYFVVRAAVLDTRRPWFENAPPADSRPDTAPVDPRSPAPKRR